MILFNSLATPKNFIPKLAQVCGQALARRTRAKTSKKLARYARLCWLVCNQQTTNRKEF